MPPAGVGKTPARSPQDHGRHPGQPPRLAPCPTVYFLQCPTTAPPRFGGKTTTSTFPYSCTPPLLVTIKGGGGLPLRGDVLDISDPATHTHDHHYTHSTTEHSRSSSRDLGASLPLSPRLYPLLQALRVQDNTGHSHTPFRWTYGPVSGTRINPCVTVLPLASTSGTRKHAAFTSWDPDPRVRTPTMY